ncbi:MAG: ATP-binding cassette domain-containing protein, partial [Duodenibacillus sp.]|nr:ATP-binding cassette domain-containing protein [Duodenibacillus sp.]
QLSGGQKQRVAIARALANDPKVLLCDEATSALDPQTTQAILKLLKEVNRRLGITIVVITHQMSVVKEICTRVAVMEGGRVVEVAPIDDIFSQPSAELTKSFINTANNVNKFLELAGEGQFEDMLRPGGKLLLLTFKGLDKAGRPFTMHLHDRYGVEPNIVYGNIDFVNGTALGKLGVAMNGEPAAVDAAVAALRAMGISVEEVR